MRLSMMVACGAASLSLLGCMNGHKMKEEHDEVKMSYADVPAAVKAGLTREAGGATISTVDKEMKDGKVVYETDVVKDGKTWEILVAEDGSLVKKKMESDDEEKEEKGEKKKD